MLLLKEFDIDESEILFISDIECFSKEIVVKLDEKIKKDKIKLIVFAGDILSFLSTENRYFKIFFNIFLKKNILKTKYLFKFNITDLKLKF
jgi:Icc-related predicted phosphoesterase